MTYSGNLEQRHFVKAAMNAPLLDADHEKMLAKRWIEQKDECALHELTGAYMRLVISMATRFRHYGIPMADLIQEGTVGLMQAAARFDPDREVRFSTYANWWIRSSIQDFVLRNWSIVRTGTTAAQKSLFFNLRRLRNKINDMDGTMMTEANKTWVAEHLGLKVKDVEAMSARMSGADRSLNAPMNTGDGLEATQWQDILPDTAAPVDMQIMIARDNARRAEWIAQALHVLNDREEKIIRARAFSEESKTLEALGKQMGISKERVRQIEHQALGKLRRALERLVGDPRQVGLIPDF